MESKLKRIRESGGHSGEATRVREFFHGEITVPDDPDVFKEGRVWEVLLIRAGESVNGNDWPADLLRASTQMFEGVTCFADHASESEMADRPERSVRDVIGWYESTRFDEVSQGIIGFLFLEDEQIKRLLREAWEAGKADLIEFSVDALVRSEPNAKGGRNVLEITEVMSVDAVTRASAGGTALRLVASERSGPEATRRRPAATRNGDRPGGPATLPGSGRTVEANREMFEKLMEMLKKIKPDTTVSESATVADLLRLLKEAAGGVEDEVLKAEVLDAIRESEAEDEAAKKKAAEDAEAKKAADESEAKNKADEEAAAQEARRKVTHSDGGTHRMSEADRTALRETRIMVCGETLNRTLAECNLPAALKESIRADFKGREFAPDDLTGRIAKDRTTWGKLEESGEVRGMGRIEVGDEETVKLGHAMDGFFAGRDIEKIPRFKSFKEAHRKVTGEWGDAYQILHESYPAHMGERTAASPRLREAARARMRESLSVSSWAQILGDSITRRMLAEYAMPGLNDWRRIASDITAVSDFRTQRRMRMGGYGLLPAVAERGTYQALTSPGDEEVTYAASKRGGTEDLPIEAIANDDMGAIRRIPAKLGRAAAITLYRFVLDFVVDNPTMDYDSVALFHASHGKLGSTALASAELDAARKDMRTQAAFGAATEILGVVPKMLLVPNELEHLAWRLVTSTALVNTNENATTPNLHQAMEVIVVDYWTDANDWAVVCDPAVCPTIEVGFFEGREEPELFVQDAPNVGGVFDADVITYKVRHIYGGDVLDHRGMWKAVVA